MKYSKFYLKISIIIILFFACNIQAIWASNTNNNARVRAGVGKPLSRSRQVKIVAVVDGVSITENDALDRIHFFENLMDAKFDAKQIEAAKIQAVQQLINEVLYEKEAKKLGLKVKDIDVDLAIKNIEVSNKMQPTKIFSLMSSNKQFEKTYKKQVRAQLLWHEIINQKVMPKIKIKKDDVDMMVANFKPSNLKVFFKQIYINDEEIIQDVMDYANRNIKTAKCENIKNVLVSKFGDAVDVIDMQMLLSETSKGIRGAIATAKVNEVVHFPGEKNKALVVCKKEILLPEEEMVQINEKLRENGLKGAIQDYLNNMKKSYLVELR